MAHARTRLNSGLTGEVDQYVPQIWRIREMRRVQRRPELAEETLLRIAPNSNKEKFLPVLPFMRWPSWLSPCASASSTGAWPLRHRATFCSSPSQIAARLVRGSKEKAFDETFAARSGPWL